ncbi:MAG: hypothetical protein AAFO94_03475, partial [Bacteroidota bacterium]
MGKNRLLTLLTTCACLFFALDLTAQDNLSTSFTTPNFLNICGDPDASSVTVSVNGLSTMARSNLTATANLFKGVQFVSFNAAASSAGVSLLDDTNPNRPVFELPDLSPTGTASVDIVFSVRANCEYTDTLAANDLLEAFDTWTYSYDMGTSTGISETDGGIANSYRNSFAVPFVTMTVPNTVGPLRVNDCSSRTIQVSNSGLNGFIDTLYYENIQEPGVYVEEVLVNGTLITVNKVANAAGDTVITALIEGAFFNGNTIGGGAGNGDAFLDKDETVTIVENICVLSCVDGRQSIHSISWGCDARFCDTDTQSSFVRIGDGAANVVYNETGSLPDANPGYCQTGQRTVTLSNDGVDIDPGFGAMIDLELGLVFEGNALIANNYTITELYIGNVLIPTPVEFNELNNNALFNTDVDGAGGLDDVDGDGFFDDLPVGESVELRAVIEFDCSSLQETTESCFNNSNATIRARTRYKDPCDDTFNSPLISSVGFGNANSGFETCSSSDAFLDVDTIYINHVQERNIINFDRNCSGNDTLYVRVALPAGVNPIIPETQVMLQPLDAPATLAGSRISNDTLILTYLGSSIPDLSSQYFIDLAFQADCSAIPGPSTFPIEVEYYCPDCDCRHLWYCEDVAGPQFHATNPPCAPAVVPVCNVGIQAIEFDVNRTTLGYADTNLNTPVDPSNANTKVAISCDTMEMKISTVVGNTALTDSIGMVISYVNVGGVTDPEETFSFGRARVRFVQGTTENFCNVTAANLVATQQDSLWTLRFDLNDCLTGLGLTLNAGDSVEFLGYFTLNPDGPYTNEFEKVPYLRAYSFATVDGVEYSCDNFGDVVEIARNDVFFNYPSLPGASFDVYPSGCAETFMNYRLFTSIDGFISYFPDEYKAAVSVDSIAFTFDPQVLIGFEVFEPSISIIGHPVHGDNFYALPPFEDFPDGNYVVRFDTLDHKPSMNLTTSPYTFRVRAIPDCNSPNASSLGNNVYQFDPTVYFTENYYARDYGDGSCARDSVLFVDDDIIYTDAPTFSFNALSNSNYTLFADTAEWTVQHCNTAFSADAGATWLAIDNPDGVLTVLSIEDVSDPLNPVDLTVTPYGATGDSVYAFAPALLRADGFNTQEDYCNTLRIKALVNQCGVSNFTARVGWNCVAYTDPLWSPDDYPPCSDESIALSVTTQDPFLDAVETDIPATNADLCDTTYVTILVENADVGAAFDIQTQLFIPLEGATFVPNSVEVAYPSGAAFVPATADPVAIGTDERGQIFQYDDFSDLNAFLDLNGLPGFNASSPSDSNEFKIRFGFS